MEATELILHLEARGARVWVIGDRLRIQPRSAVTADLMEQLRQHKGELLDLLRGWPVECLDSERQFGQPHARLFPLIRRTVQTPLGPGRLIQVLAQRAAVVLDAHQETLTFLIPEEIRPAGSPWTEHELKTPWVH